MEKDLTTTTTTSPSLNFSDLSKIFFESGIFKDIKSQAQAMVKILAGIEIGLSPIQAMNSVYIIENKIGYETKIFLSKIKESGKYDYKVDYEIDDKGVILAAKVEFLRAISPKQMESIGVSIFTRNDAIRIGLINKDVYKKYPKLMMFYRAASDGIKLYCPDILRGAPLFEDYLEINGNGNSGSIKIEGGKIEAI